MFIIGNLFNNLFDEAEKLLQENDIEKEWENLLNDFNNENKEDEPKNSEKSYYHYVADKFEDGQHVSHREKEVKDGKVLKDVDACCKVDCKKNENNKIEEKKTKCNEKECDQNVGKAYRELEEKNKSLKEQVEELKHTTYNLMVEKENYKKALDMTNLKLTEMEKLNKDLQIKLSQIKEML